MEEAEAAAAATAVSFPEDIVREILVRVEHSADLFRCATACRRWRRLVAKPSLLHRRWPEPHASAFLAGFFTAKRLAITDYAAATSLVPTPGSVFGPDRRFLSSFFPDTVESGLLDGAVPLIARHGFVLMRLAPETPGRRGDLRMAMFNLLAGTCDMLPPLKWEWSDDAVGCAILTGTDCSSNGKQGASSSSGHPASFKLVTIKMCGDRPRKVFAFTSGEASWSKLCEFSFDQPGIGPILHPNAVVCRGTAHWLFWYAGLHILNLNVETFQVSTTSIPVPIKNILSKKTHDVPQLSIDVSGTLSVLHLQRKGLLLGIWTKRDDKENDGGGDAQWESTFLELRLPKHIQSEAQAMYLSFLGENGGMLLLKDNHRHIYAVDLKTGVMQELMNHGRISRTKVVPFEMDWPTFFISRLGSK